MTAPSPVQRIVLKHVADSITARGFAPTIRELLATTGHTSTNGMREHLVALQRKGLLERGVKSARALRLTAAGRKALGDVRCPHCGRAAA